MEANVAERQAQEENLKVLENKIWTRAVQVAHGVNGDAKELAALVRDHPWLPKHLGPLGPLGREKSGTLLIAAAWADHSDAVAMLGPVSNIRALDEFGESALFYAVLCDEDDKRQKMVEALAAYADLGARSGNRLNQSPAIISVERGQPATTTFILSLMTSEQMALRCDRGANVWHYICRSWEAEVSWIDMIEQMPGAALILDIEDKEGETPRTLASKRGDEFGVRLLAKAEEMEMNALIGEAPSVKNRPRL